MVDVYSTERGSARDADMDTYHNDAIEKDVPPAHTVSLRGTLVVAKTVELEINPGEGDIQ